MSREAIKGRWNVLLKLFFWGETFVHFRECLSSPPNTNQLHSLKLTANAPENRPSQKETRKSSNHPLPGAMLASRCHVSFQVPCFREGKTWKIPAVWNIEPPLPLPVQPLVQQHPVTLQGNRELVLEHLPRRRWCWWFRKSGEQMSDAWYREYPPPFCLY